MDGWDALDLVVTFAVGVLAGLLVAAYTKRPSTTAEPVPKE